MNKADYANSGLKPKQVIKYVTDDRPKKKIIDGHWTDLDETEPCIKAFNIYRA
jgi:hypothetical protein